MSGLNQRKTSIIDVRTGKHIRVIKFKFPELKVVEHFCNIFLSTAIFNINSMSLKSFIVELFSHNITVAVAHVCTTCNFNVRPTKNIFVLLMTRGQNKTFCH